MMFAYLTENCFRPVSIQEPIPNPIPEIPNVRGFYPNYIDLLDNHLPYGVPNTLKRLDNVPESEIPFNSNGNLLGLTSILYYMCELLGLKNNPPRVSEPIKQYISQQLTKSVAKENYVAFYFDLSTIIINCFRQTGHLDAYLLNIRNRIVLFASQKTNQDCSELASLLYHTSSIPFQFYGRSAKEDDWDEKTQPALLQAFQTYFTPSRILTELITEIKIDLRQKTSYQGAQKTSYTSTEQHGFMQLLSELFDTVCDETSLMQPDKTDLNWLAISQLLLATMIRKGYFSDFTPSLLEVKNTDNPILDITWPEELISSPEDVSSLLPFLTNTLAGAHALLNTQSLPQPIPQAVLYYFVLLKNDPTTLMAFKTHYYTHKPKLLTALIKSSLSKSDIPPFADAHLQENPFFIFCIQQLPISEQITVLKPMLSSILTHRPEILKSVLRTLEAWPESEQVAILTQPRQYLMHRALENNQDNIVDALMVHMKSFSPQDICHVIGVIANTQASSIKTDWSQLPHYFSSTRYPIICILLKGISNLPPETKRAILIYDKDQQSLLKLVLNYTLQQAFFDKFYEQNADILSYQLQQLPTDFFRLHHDSALFYLNAIKTLSTTGMLPTTFLPNLILNPTTLQHFLWIWSTKEKINSLQNTMLALAAENPTLFLSGIETNPDVFFELLTHHLACDEEKITQFFSMIPAKQLSHFLTKKPKQTYESSHLENAIAYPLGQLKPVLQAITSTLLQPEYFGLLFKSVHILTNLATIKDTSLTYSFRQTILDFSEENQALFFQEMDKNPHALLSLFLTHEDEGIDRLFVKISPERKINYLTLKDHKGLSLLEKALSCSEPAILSTLIAMNTTLSGKDIRSILTNNHCSAFKSIAKQPHTKIFSLLISLFRKSQFSTPDRHQLFLMALATQQDATRGFLFCVITEELLNYRGITQNNCNIRKLFAGIMEGHYLGTSDIEDSYHLLIHTTHHPSFSFKLEVKFINYLESIKSDVPTELYRSLFTSYLTYLRTSATPSHRLALIARWNAAFKSHQLAEISSQYISWIDLHDELISVSDAPHSLAEAPYFFSRNTRRTTIPPHSESHVDESKMSV